MSGIMFAGLYLSFLVIQLMRKNFKSVLALFFCVIAGLVHYAVVDISYLAATESARESFKVVMFFSIAAVWSFALDSIDSHAAVPAYMLVMIMFSEMVDFFTISGVPVLSNNAYVMAIILVNAMALTGCLMDEDDANGVNPLSIFPNHHKSSN